MKPDFTQRQEIEKAFDVLFLYDLPVKSAWESYQELVSHANREPSESDRLWPLDVSDLVSVHLAEGDDRPALSCRLVVGRMYSLTAAQRDVIRDMFNAQLARLVEVLAVDTFDETAANGAKIVRSVVIKTVEHIDPKRRKGSYTKFTISKWGEFCSRCVVRQMERDQEQAIRQVADKVEALYDAFDKEQGRKTYRGQRRSREVAMFVLAGWESGKVVEDEAKKEVMKQELARLQLGFLIKFFKEPGLGLGGNGNGVKGFRPTLDSMMKELEESLS